MLLWFLRSGFLIANCIVFSNLIAKAFARLGCGHGVAIQIVSLRAIFGCYFVCLAYQSVVWVQFLAVFLPKWFIGLWLRLLFQLRRKNLWKVVEMLIRLILTPHRAFIHGKSQKHKSIKANYYLSPLNILIFCIFISHFASQW